MTAMSPMRGGILQPPTSQEGRFSQSLERGLALLRSFTPERPWMGIAELADELGMSRPTTHRYATTLVVLGYLEQGPRRKYRLGARAGDPGRSAIDATGLHKYAYPHLLELRQRTTCTASMAVLDGTDIVYIERVRSSQQGHSEVAKRLGRGSRLPAHQTAMGKMLLAHHPREQQMNVLEAPSVSDASQAKSDRATKALLGELERIRESGFAVADQAHVSGQRCVAAPVMLGSNKALAAVDVAAPKSIISKTQLLDRLAPMVVESAEGISALIAKNKW